MLYAFVLPYKMSSTSSRKIAEALGVKRIFVSKDTYVPKPHHILVNWGSHREYTNVYYVNHPQAVQVAANKLKTFKCFKEHDIQTVPWTTSKVKVAEWLKQGHTVFARTLLNASEGKGIVEMSGANTTVTDAPLYTQYKKKKFEFRVHVFNNKVIDVQQKRKKKDFDEQATSALVRSYNNGWVFCRKDVVEPKGIRKLAVDAVKCLQLDFGAVDIIYNESEDKCYVLEVNTAPGIEGKSVPLYANALKAYLQKLQNAPTNVNYIALSVD